MPSFVALAVQVVVELAEELSQPVDLADGCGDWCCRVVGRKAGGVDRGRTPAHSSDMLDDDPPVPEPSPTAEELAGTIFADVADYSQDNGGAVLSADAAIGGGDG